MERRLDYHLGGIDAPEKAQPFGQRSKENFSRLMFKKGVTRHQLQVHNPNLLIVRPLK